MEEAQAGFELRVAERVTTLERRCEAGEKAVHAAVAALAAAAIAAAALTFSLAGRRHRRRRRLPARLRRTGSSTRPFNS